ncbi:hypothetical protein [Streptomyces sp. NPDC049590]|uniref:hypothetical protein n=1 Tax=Streptomyces sp. NPDC049590 TaxID=3154834 RepID=UPI00343AF687
MWFPGLGERTSLSRSERTNLPDKVAPGREYRDALVVHHLATRLTGQPADGPDDEDGAGV